MNLSQSDIASITQEEFRHGTTRFLPAWDQIPDLFKKELYGPNLYSSFVAALYSGDRVPEAQVTFNPGFGNPFQVKLFMMAHLVSFEPEHEHKIAGCAYMLSQILTLKE